MFQKLALSKQRPGPHLSGYFLIHTFLHVHTYLYSNRIRLPFFIFFLFFQYQVVCINKILRSHFRGTHLNFNKKKVHEMKFWRNLILDFNVSF